MCKTVKKFTISDSVYIDQKHLTHTQACIAILNNVKYKLTASCLKEHTSILKNMKHHIPVSMDNYVLEKYIFFSENVTKIVTRES